VTTFYCSWLYLFLFFISSRSSPWHQSRISMSRFKGQRSSSKGHRVPSVGVVSVCQAVSL